MTAGSNLVRRLAAFAAASAFVATIACGSDSALEPEPQSSISQTPGGTDSSTNNTPPATSNGPVASVVVSPKQVSIPQGYYTRLVARPLDANGVLVANKRAQWRSSDVQIAVPSDTGIVYGKAVGTAKIYAAVDGHTDSATITVTTAVPPPPPPPRDTVPSLPPPVASFALNVIVVGFLGGTDTLATEPIVGATIKVTRFAAVNGDTLNPSVDAGTALTNASGGVSFKDLPGGYYAIVATPPAGSPYRSATIALLPPRTSEVNVRIVMRR